MKRKIKGIVLSIENSHALILTVDGQFVKVKSSIEPCFIGMEIVGEVREVSSTWRIDCKHWVEGLKRPIFQLAIAMVLTLVVGVGSWAYPVGRIYMEVNPSVGLSYNIYHRVIGAESYNADGAGVIKGLSIYGKPLSEGIADMFRTIEKQGYIKTGDAEMSGVILGYSDDEVMVEAVSAIGKVSEEVQKPVVVAAVEVTQDSKRISQNAAKSAKTDLEKSVEWTPVKVAIAKKKESAVSTKDKETLKSQQKEIEREVSRLSAQSTADIIKENEQNVKQMKDERIETVKKKIEVRKEKKKDEEKKKKEPVVTDKPIKSKKTVEKSTVDKQIEKLQTELAQLRIEREMLSQSELPKKEKVKQLKRIDKQIEHLIKQLDELGEVTQ
jgi:hypothetical protein